MSGRRHEVAAAKHRIDPGSKRTLLRVGLRSGGIAILIFWPWLAGLRPLSMALDTIMVFGAFLSLFCGMVAIGLREPFARGSLNHWDEAMFYTALARLIHFVHG